VTLHWNKRELPWIALIGASFVFGLAVSWQRWGNPLVDCGREMNQPLRLLGGEFLYSDVRHIYGPFSPYLNAGLFRVFGVSLGVLTADGIVTAAIILGLVYWLARRLMGPYAATVATLTVMWLCAFKQAGNYILPYSYGAIHGAALGLISLVSLVRTLNHENPANSNESPSKSSAAESRGFFIAGVFAGLATLAKSEMGMAALSAGLAAAVVSVYPDWRRAMRHIAVFLAPALVLVVSVYAYFVHEVGWYTLSSESWVFFRNLAPELVYFNKRVSGFDEPLRSLLQICAATLKLAALAAMIGAISWTIGRFRGGPGIIQVPQPRGPAMDAGRITQTQLLAILAASVLVLGLIPLAANMDWDKGPYLAMPLLLAIFLIWLSTRFQREATLQGIDRNGTATLIVVAVYALASLARVILRVRSGGAYSSYLLPVSVILFTYGWAVPFSSLFKDVRVQRLARNIALSLLFADVIVTAGLLGYRFRTRNTTPVRSARGTIIAVPDLGQAWNEALDYIDHNTMPGDAVAVFPEGTSLDFFSGRRNPLREEIITPGFLDFASEERAINQLRGADTKLIFITNRKTEEFGAAVFGQDYCRHLMEWIDQNYERCGMFGPDKNPDLEIGDRTFFIRAYRRKSIVAAELAAL
jgi:hypothetical protein